MRNFKYKTFSLICVCTVLVAVWATDIVAAERSKLVENICRGEFEIDCDSDDSHYWEDNCPETYNPGQQDADNDGTGDACDDDTIYGTISGELKEDIDVNIAISSCSSPTIIATLITDEDGYFSIGDLEANLYLVFPEDFDYIFVPDSVFVQVRIQ